MSSMLVLMMGISYLCRFLSYLKLMYEFVCLMFGIIGRDDNVRSCGPSC